MDGLKHDRQSKEKLLLSFYSSEAPFKTLLMLYRRDWHKLALAMLYYVIKYSPDWIRPVVIANIIDIIFRPQQHTLEHLWLNGAILYNVPVGWVEARNPTQPSQLLGCAVA